MAASVIQVAALLTGLLAVQAPESDPAATLGALTEAERTALATAVDGRDHQESAFAALMSALQRVEPEQVEVGSLETLSPETAAALLEDPDARRGDAFLLAGRLEQSEPLARPWSGWVEWFIRLPDDRAVAVYLPTADDRPPGERVRVAGRFYKRIAADARDGTRRSWLAFGGRRLPAAPDAVPRQVLVTGIVLLLLGWVLLSLLTRRRGASPVRPAGSAVAGAPREPTSLPADPAEALDELARRHDDPTRKDDP